MMKQKFYEYVDKYLTEMGIDLNAYEDLREQTIREFALNMAEAGKSSLDVAWDVDEMYADAEAVYGYAPDSDDPEVGKRMKEACRKAEEREYWENEERLMCRSVLAKIMLTCDPSTLTRANLDLKEKEFLIAYDFYRLRFRERMNCEV